MHLVLGGLRTSRTFSELLRLATVHPWYVALTKLGRWESPLWLLWLEWLAVLWILRREQA